MNSTAKWYTLYTRQGSEKKVASILSRKNIENYCPLNKVKPSLKDWKKVSIEPLLVSYVFVKVSEHQLKLVNSIEGVINVVYWLGKPAIINNEEIEVIKRFTAEYENVQIQKIPFNANDTKREIGSSSSETKGHLISFKNNNIKITLPSLGYIMSAELTQSHAEALAVKNHSNPFSEKTNIRYGLGTGQLSY